uniref:Ubiquitin-like protease family profile domain-containing protein n=1 Tax=Oryza brachyantha TaxID=4533 RepID=J3M5B5_ORYBR
MPPSVTAAAQSPLQPTLLLSAASPPPAPRSRRQPVQFHSSILLCEDVTFALCRVPPPPPLRQVPRPPPLRQISVGFGQHPKFHQNLDIVELAKTVCSWSKTDYNIARCKSILVPIEQGGTFILVILDQNKRKLHILDPNPLNPIYKNNPNGRYIKKLLCLAEHLKKAMRIECPRSTWAEDINLWSQINVSNVPIHNRMAMS